MSDNRPKPTPQSGAGSSKTASVKPPAAPKPGTGAPLSKSDKGTSRK